MFMDKLYSMLQKKNYNEEDTNLLLLYDELIYDDVDEKTSSTIIKKELTK